MNRKVSIDQYVFFLGGNDAEMVTIREILESRNATFHDKDLSWGASLSAYQEELKTLQAGQVPVFVELNLDCPYPGNAKVVDHHRDSSGMNQNTSIEQVADLLGIELSYYHKLISANDKGHIPAMRKLCASPEEIFDIRKLDLSAQGATLKDNKLAEESIRKYTEKIGQDVIIVDSLTPRTSVIFDKIWGQYRHCFCYTHEGKELDYSGTGEMVSSLIKHYEEKQVSKEQYWWGGDMPDYGFFGTKVPIPKNELKTFVTEHLGKDIISQHIFLFPFRIEKRNDSDEDAPDLQEILGTFKDTRSGWFHKHYDPVESPAHYSEYFYFHDYVRKTIFETKPGDNENTGLAVSHYFERSTDKNAHMIIHIKHDDNEKEETAYKLTINHLSLRLFETGIGMVSIELLNFDHHKIADVLQINDFGRRIYPQFLSNDNGIEVPKKTFLADRIEFYCGTIKKEECLSFERYFTPTLEIAKYMNALLGEPFNEKFKCLPVIDDRMYTICWYGSDSWSRLLKRESKSSGRLAYETSDEWYKFIFVDGKTIGVASEKMKQDLIANSTYHRWVGAGTFFGITRYSLMCLADRGWFSCNILRQHMETMYYQMAVILLAQRASLLKFSDDVTRISQKIKDISSVEDNKGSRQREKILGEVNSKVNKLHSDYIRFINRMWFPEVTPQEQGIEMYDMAVIAMALKQQMAELNNEIKELHEFVELNYEKTSARKLSTLSILGFIFIPVSLVISFWGMDLYFRKHLNFSKKIFLPYLEHLELLGSVIFFAVTFFYGYKATKNIGNIFQDKEEYGINELIKLRTLSQVLLCNKGWVFLMIIVILFLFIYSDFLDPVVSKLLSIF